MFKSVIKPLKKASKAFDKTGKLAKALYDVASKEVYIGIPQEKASRKGEEINNAELAYIHTHGSPVNNIPPRPFLIPSILANLDSIKKIQKEVIQAAVEGKAVITPMKKLGLFASAEAKKWFLDSRNNWKPNTPETIRRKGSDSPLIDSGALRASITYVIDKK
jgi:hypothetical protein